MKGDMVIFMPPNGNRKAVKNLTIGKEYFVTSCIIRDSEFKTYPGNGGYKTIPCTPHVDTINVVNDKGLDFGYSAKHFMICGEGIHFSLGLVEDKNRAAFMAELKDL